MKVVVTGATGFVGRPLVRELMARGHEVIAWTRDPARARIHLPALCAVEAWDPHATIDNAQLRGVDANPHIAGQSVVGGRRTKKGKNEFLTSCLDS